MLNLNEYLEKHLIRLSKNPDKLKIKQDLIKSGILTKSGKIKNLVSQ